MRKKTLFTIAFISALLFSAVAGELLFVRLVVATPSTEWIKTYPSLDGEGYSVIQTTDGGYAIAGQSNSSFLLLKVDSSGSLQWNKTYEEEVSTPSDRAYSVVQTSDGGYALAGHNYAGLTNFIKTDSQGNMQWNKTFSKPDAVPPLCIESILETNDFGFVLVGYLRGGFGDWVIKTDRSGNIQWNKTYGMRYGLSLTEAHNSGYIVNVAGSMPMSGPESYLLKIDVNGDVQWNVTCGWSNSLIRTGDGGYVLSGASEGVGWLEKRNGQGEQEWRSGILGEGAYPYSFFQSVAQAPDGGYIVAGSVAEHALHFGYDVARIVKTDSSGNKVWSQVYEAGCHAHSIIVSNDGKYVFTGSKSDVVWLVKIGEAPSPTDTSPTSPPSSTSSPSPTLEPSPTANPSTPPSPSPSASPSESELTPSQVATVAAAASLSIAVVSIGLIVYFKKRKH